MVNPKGCVQVLRFFPPVDMRHRRSFARMLCPKAVCLKAVLEPMGKADMIRAKNHGFR
jgi:hypothetical protein